MRELDGRTHGLKTSQIERLEALFRRKVRGLNLISPELAKHLAEISHDVHRQVGVLVGRGGEIERVVIGEATRLYLPDLGRARGGTSRFRGLRLVRTSLRPGEALTSEDLADLSRLRLDAVVVLVVDHHGGPRNVHWARLVPDPKTRTIESEAESYPSVGQVPEDAMGLVVEAEAEMARVFGNEARTVERAAAVLVGVHKNARRVRPLAEESMAELAELARTAEVRVVDRVIQIRREIDPRTVVGKGKIEELSLRAIEHGADTLIFDRELSPSQLRAITDSTELKVLDRTQLILDIFAHRAKSRDGKLQVELAQLKYALPRLAEKSTALSRLTGGIGGQGPGETKLEIHKRRARDRIHRLEEELEAVATQRRVRREARRRSGVPVVSIVGYTNAGKSTLLNALTHAHALAEDKLFATLDTTSRRVRFPSERQIVLTDTVGFIKDLPKDLVNAFKATLEELDEADLLLHVIDGSDPHAEDKRRAVEALLGELALSAVPTLVVINKVDQGDPLVVAAIRNATGGVPVSALTRTNLGTLIAEVEAAVFAHREELARVEAAERARLEV